MELVVSEFDHEKSIQVVHVKCRDSNIILDSKTFNRKIDVKVADYKRQIFEVMVRTKDGWCEHMQYYQLNDSGKMLVLNKIHYRWHTLIPKYGIILCYDQNVVTICDVKTLKELSSLRFEEKVLITRADGEYMFVFFDTKTIVIDYETNQRYIFDPNYDKKNVKSFIANLKEAPYLLQFKDLLDKNWTSFDDLLEHATIRDKHVKFVIPFSEHYMSAIKKNLLTNGLTDVLIDWIIIPLLGF